MSLKDEIKESLKDFVDPLKQDISNVKDDIKDAIYVSKHKEEFKEEKKTQEGGCLKKVLVYGFVILAILAFLKNGCSFNSTIERDGVENNTNQEEQGISKESLYDACILASEENVDELLAQNPINEAELWSEYEFLLTCLSSEYMFKVMAYGHYTGEYEPERFGSITQKSNRIVEEMKGYFDADSVEKLHAAIAVEAYDAFDDSNFYYDNLLVGSTNTPDVDAMWKRYIESEISVD